MHACDSAMHWNTITSQREMIIPTIYKHFITKKFHHAPEFVRRRWFQILRHSMLFRWQSRWINADTMQKSSKCSELTMNHDQNMHESWKSRYFIRNWWFINTSYLILQYHFTVEIIMNHEEIIRSDDSTLLHLDKYWFIRSIHYFCTVA